MHFKSLRTVTLTLQYLFTLQLYHLYFGLCKHIELYVQYNFNTIHHNIILTIYQNQNIQLNGIIATW